MISCRICLGEGCGNLQPIQRAPTHLPDPVCLKPLGKANRSRFEDGTVHEVHNDIWITAFRCYSIVVESHP